jgi:CheY-like chemotaxis protein
MPALQQPSSSPEPHKQVVLCIDDQADGLTVRKLFLETMGYEVLTASSGRTGLDLLGTHTIDAVVLDYRMPEMDGEAVATELRRLKPDLPILMLSGYVPEIPERVHQLVDAFVNKGAPPMHLVAALETVLGPPRKKPARSASDVVEQAKQQLEYSRAVAARSRDFLRRMGKSK